MTHDDNTTLQGKRKRINIIDAGILSLLQERAQLAMEIKQIKRDTGLEIEDLSREQELKNYLQSLNENSALPDEHLIEIWGKIIELSKKIQS